MVVDGFTTQSIASETVAETLRRKRAEHGFTLDDVVAHTKIQKRYVVALENGSYDQLPADVYVRGFLRSYGELLGLDQDILLQRYIKERSVERRLQAPKKGEGLEVRASSSSFFSRFSNRFVVTPRLLLIGVVVLLFFGVFGYLLYQIGSFTAAPSIILERPDRDITVDSSTFTVIGTAESYVDVLVNGQEVFVDSDGRFSTTITIQEGINEILVIGRNQAGKETRILRNIVVEEN